MGIETDVHTIDENLQLNEQELAETNADEGVDTGLIPIILPHKNRARYILLNKQNPPHLDSNEKQYHVIENNHATMLAGAIGYITNGFLAAGGGGILQFTKDYSSIRNIIGIENAYMAKELYPPKTLNDVLSWHDNYTNISYHSLCGLKLVLGFYAVIHTGATFELEGIWSHRVIKEDNIITVSLLLKKQHRLKWTSGIAPFNANNIDIFHQASETELTFRFSKIEKFPDVKQVLENILLKKNDDALINAHHLFVKYQAMADESPIVFVKNHARKDKDKRNRFRFRVPLISNWQSVDKKRDRTTVDTKNHSGNNYQSQQDISEIIHRNEHQTPIEIINPFSKNYLYPKRMTFNRQEGFNWPLEYRNHKLEKITQIINTKDDNGQLGYENNRVVYLWQLSDNYISRESFITTLNQIGDETGLKPLFFRDSDISHYHYDRAKESMLLTLELSIRSDEKESVYQNLLKKSFLDKTLLLFDKYLTNPEGDYLNLSESYDNKKTFSKVYKDYLQYQIINLLDYAHKIHHSVSTQSKRRFKGLYQQPLKEINITHYQRNLWDKIKKNPFIFLMAFEGISPACHLSIIGTSTNIKRSMELSLARDIMESKGTIPLKYQTEKKPTYLKPILSKEDSILLNDDFKFNSANYYSDTFFNFVKTNSIKKIVIVVSSLSDGALENPRSPYIGSRQSRDLPHHLLMQQKLKTMGCELKIYYLAFDNTLHFNHKDKRAVDNTLLPAFQNYIVSLVGGEMDSHLLEAIYLNPQYVEKSGDLIIDSLPVIIGPKGNCLSFTGQNALQLKMLRKKINHHRKEGDYILGFTAHSTGSELEKLSDYLKLDIIGCDKVALHFGTKEGNKALFSLADVPFVYGTHRAEKNIDALIDDCFHVAFHTRCKRLMIKHNSSSAGKGNLIVNISSCYLGSENELSKEKLSDVISNALLNYRHPEKDLNLKVGTETFYMRKIRELGAIVEEMIEAKDIVSPGSLGLIHGDGAVSVEYIYDQILTGKDGQNFGGSLGPSELGEKDILEMNDLTKKIGKTLFEQGMRGYFGLDFLKCDDASMIVIEANLRKTGTRYPYMLSKYLMDEKTLNKKHMFHDDNIKLPFTLSDLTGRNYTLKHFMNALFEWLTYHDITYSAEKGIGAIVSFDTHSIGKIGVLTISDTREGALNQNSEFKNALINFSQEYIGENLTKHAYGMSLFKENSISSEDEFKDETELNYKKGLVYGAVIKPPQSISSINKASNFLQRKKHEWPMAVSTFFNGTKPKKESFNDDIEPSYSPINSPKNAYKQNSNDRDLVFVILGKATTSDYLLIEAAKTGIICYRMTEESQFTYHHKSQKGFISRVRIPLLNPKTNEYKMYLDESNHYPLPTVIYNYDFSSLRRLFQQGRGSRTYFDDSLNLQAKLKSLNIATFNAFNPEWLSLNALSPLRSQLAYLKALEKTSQRLFEAYPEMIAIPNLIMNDGKEKLVAFIFNHKSFYIKRALFAHDKDNHQTKVYAYKKNQTLILEYFVEVDDKNIKSIKPKFIKMSLSNFTLDKFLNALDYIKDEIGVPPSTQFLLQANVSNVLLLDKSQRALATKIRVVTLHNDYEKITSTSIYGVYGGKSAYLGYVGSPRIYFNAAKNSGCLLDKDYSWFIDELNQTAKLSHLAIEKIIGSSLGEVITTFIISNDAIIPLKANIKPERLDLESISKQTHFGEYLEGDFNNRQRFLHDLEKQEQTRTSLILNTVKKRHQQTTINDEIKFNDFAKEFDYTMRI